jgi:hypothetical protein
VRSGAHSNVQDGAPLPARRCRGRQGARRADDRQRLGSEQLVARRGPKDPGCARPPPVAPRALGGDEPPSPSRLAEETESMAAPGRDPDAPADTVTTRGLLDPGDLLSHFDGETIDGRDVPYQQLRQHRNLVLFVLSRELRTSGSSYLVALERWLF